MAATQISKTMTSGSRSVAAAYVGHRPRDLFPHRHPLHTDIDQVLDVERSRVTVNNEVLDKNVYESMRGQLTITTSPPALSQPPRAERVTRTLPPLPQVVTIVGHNASEFMYTAPNPDFAPPKDRLGHWTNTASESTYIGPGPAPSAPPKGHVVHWTNAVSESSYTAPNPYLAAHPPDPLVQRVPTASESSYTSPGPDPAPLPQGIATSLREPSTTPTEASSSPLLRMRRTITHDQPSEYRPFIPDEAPSPTIIVPLPIPSSNPRTEYRPFIPAEAPSPTIIVPLPPPISSSNPRTEYRNASGPDEEAPHWKFDIHSQQLRIYHADICQRQFFRSTKAYESQLHDLLAGSLLPLTQEYKAGRIREQAESFFASFASDAKWEVHVENLEPKVAQVIYGLTVNSRNPSPEFRFFRFRFPHVSFEWFVQTPYSEIDRGVSQKPVDVQIIWKAWARKGPASGLVAYGTIVDTVELMALLGPDQRMQQTLVITNREFYVTRVFQPELMTPDAYTRIRPPYKKKDDFLNFSTSWTVIQFLRSSQSRLAFLVAISALFASLQPMIDKRNVTAGYIFTGIGVLSGLISVIATVLSWSLDWSERNAAKERQSDSELV